MKGFLGKLRSRKDNIDNFLVGYFRCSIGGVRVSRDKNVNEKENAFSNIKLYPNPVLRSQKVNVELESVKEGKINLKLFSLDNRLINSKEYQVRGGKIKISYFMNTRLASGIYILQIFDESNHLVKAEKLIIQ